jgi:hypothetical protein
MAQNSTLPAATLLSSVLLAACGGGDSAPVASPTNDQRVAAATATATTNPMCAESTLGPFYWEIGDSAGTKASGSIGSAAPIATTMMSIASASKWLYSTYVVQRVGVRPADIPFLNFTSGYSNFTVPICLPTDTVESCLDTQGNDVLVQSTVGKFAYGSGHMQHHAASFMGLGLLGNAALTDEIQSRIGDFGFVYTQPQLAGGASGSAAGYAAFLRRILGGELAMLGALGSNKVCTNPTTCSTAVGSPIPDTESWNYSLGHWVEDDPLVGDHAYSSAGAFGFYPWIDRTKTLYGVVARVALETNAGYRSAQCGRLIRQAWVTGITVTGG